MEIMHRETKPHFGCYICFDLLESSSAARTIQNRLHKLLGKPVLLGGSHGVPEEDGHARGGWMGPQRWLRVESV